jgi:hypothetical protein
VTALTVHRAPQPLLMAAIVAAIGVSFLAGERVGVRLASSRGFSGPQACVAQVEPWGAPQAGDAQETSGIGADCNTDYR